MILLVHLCSFFSKISSFSDFLLLVQVTVVMEPEKSSWDRQQIFLSNNTSDPSSILTSIGTAIGLVEAELAWNLDLRIPSQKLSHL